MRSLFLELVANGTAFTRLADAEAWIDSLMPNARPKPPKSLIEAMPDLRLQSLLLRLYDSDIGTFRNRVVHKDAYRPTREEAEDALNHATELLHPLTTLLRLRGDASWYMARTGR